MKHVCLIGFIGLIVLIGFTRPVMADEISDLKEELNGLKERIQEVEGIEADENEHLRAASGPSLSLDGFTDISYTAQDTDDAGSNDFALGQFDLFITSRLSDNISFLGETVFEFNDNNEAILDLERVDLKYTFTEWLAINVGRMHTSLGHWNTAYHHSTWLHTSASRPLLYNWEDENGIMPVHIVGIEFSGRRVLGQFDLKYVFDIGNGRGETLEKIQNMLDGNDNKAINLLVGMKPDFIPGLEFGFNIYKDNIPADTDVPARDGEIEELIFGGYFVYLGDEIELLGEISNIDHDDEVTNEDYDTLGLYIQGSYNIDDLTPYYRFERVDFADGDPYYEGNIDDNDIVRQIVGLRWDINTWHALKLEYSLSDRKEPGDDAHAVTVNASFRF